MSSLYTTPLWLVAAGVALLILSGLELGHRLGRRAPVPDRQLSATSTPVLGLVGLLLAFSFALAAERHAVRRAATVDEANAIGTFWLRTDLLPAAAREPMRSRVRRYVDLHFEHRRAGLDPAVTAAAESEASRLQQEMWAMLMRQVERDLPAPAQLLLTPALNGLIDSYGTVLAARENRIPDAVLGLLFVLVLVAGLLVGYGAPGQRRRPLLWMCLVLVLGGIVTVLVDADRPRRGLIRSGIEPYERLRQSLQAR